MAAPLNLGLETHSFMVHGTKFEICNKYTILEPVGQGAYGVVCAAQNKDSQEDVAIKKIENAFEHITFTKRTLRELRILRHLQHENLIDIQDIFLPGKKEDFDDIYVVSALMETDLASILKSTQALSDDHCQFFLYQILRGIKYVHSAEVIHRDLKPRNLLVNSNCDLKICDFGLARVNFSDEEFKVCPMTEYVCTRWYRAPEVLCSWTNYSCAIDIWSIGCIFAEMLNRKPLLPGHNTQHQLQLIIQLLGTPGPAELENIPNDKCRNFIKTLPPCKGKNLAEVHSEASQDALQLLTIMLNFAPEKRKVVDDSLKSTYLSQLHCPDDEPTRSKLDTTDFEFERRKITDEALRDEIFAECLTYHPQKQKLYSANFDIKKYRLLEPGESQYSDDDED